MSTPEERQDWPSDELVDQAAKAIANNSGQHPGIWRSPTIQTQARAALSVVAPVADLREVERLARENKQLWRDFEALQGEAQKIAGQARESLREMGAERDAARSALVSAQERVAELERENGRLSALLGSHRDGHRCTCEMLSPQTHLEPAEWEWNPYCPTHGDVEHVIRERDAARAQRDGLARRATELRKRWRDYDQKRVAAYEELAELFFPDGDIPDYVTDADVLNMAHNDLVVAHSDQAFPVTQLVRAAQARVSTLESALRLCQEDRDAARAELGRAKNGARWLQERLESLIKETEAQQSKVADLQDQVRLRDRYIDELKRTAPSAALVIPDDAATRLIEALATVECEREHSLSPIEAAHAALSEVRSWSPPAPAVQGEPAATFNLGQETDMATYARLGGRVPVGEPAAPVPAEQRDTVHGPDCLFNDFDYEGPVCVCDLAPAPAVPDTADGYFPQELVFQYRNHRGEIGWRRVLPSVISFQPTVWHPEPQWILVARDLDKGEDRSFALCDILRFGAPAPTPVEGGETESGAWFDNEDPEGHDRGPFDVPAPVKLWNPPCPQCQTVMSPEMDTEGWVCTSCGERASDDPPGQSVADETWTPQVWLVGNRIYKRSTFDGAIVKMTEMPRSSELPEGAVELRPVRVVPGAEEQRS